MPIYSYRCLECKAKTDVMLKVSELDDIEVECKECSKNMERFISSPPTIAGAGLTTSARIPINIYDEKPDGSVQVHRIGAKRGDD